MHEHGGHPTTTFKMVCTRKIPRFVGKTRCWREEKSCFTIASLLKDMTIQLHELTGYRTPNIGFFVRMLMGPRKPLRQRQEFADALKQCLEMQDAHLAETATICETDTSTTSTSVNDKISNVEGGENFDYYVDRKTGWRYYREPRRKLAGSIFIFVFNFAVPNFAMANKLELVATYII